VLADAGLIARVDLLDPRVDLFDAQRRPYRITIAREQIVAVQSADDLLPGR
jgi:hypothetical protein